MQSHKVFYNWFPRYWLTTVRLHIIFVSGIISVPVAVKIPMMSESTYSKALQAKVNKLSDKHSLTLLHSEQPKLHGSFGCSECNRVIGEYKYQY